MIDDNRSHADASWYTPYLRALEITRVPELQRPWCIRSLKRFADFLKNKPLPDAVRDDVESFITVLRSTPGPEEWKIRSAYLALRLLLTAVYGKSWELAKDAPSGSGGDGDALVFWFKQALGKEFGDLGGFQKSKRPHFVPVVLTRSEISRLLAAMDGDTALMASLLYGAGLRLQELITLRVKDIDLERRQITVREGKVARTV